MAKIRETTLEIDLKALAHNFKYMRSKIGENTKLMGVVKAFAYGSKAPAIAKKLVACGADYLAVAYAKEGVALRQSGVEAPILILHPQSVYFEQIIAHKLIPSLYSRWTLQTFITTAKKSGQTDYPVHLKLNTGLNRLGFESGETAEVISILNHSKAVKVDGIYSHFAASEDENERAFTLNQYEKFKAESSKIITQLGGHPLRHMCNTSGILNYPEAHFDMVRTGIGLYGYGNSEAEDQNLIPVSSLKTLISQIHQLKKGDTVSYNRRFTAEKETKIAVLPLGYADGLRRYFGNGQTQVSINGALAPIVGDVCMDMTMVDVSGIDCHEGDEVVVFGKNKSAEEMAQTVGTISYELITAISQRVKRVVIE